MKPDTQNYNTSGFLPNILDLYDNPAYMFKLYMIPDIDIYNENYDTSNKIIIAQSGVTGQIAIEDVEIESNITPNPTYKNLINRTINFKLQEYAGVQLIDKLVSASLDIGVSNYMEAPYFLELTFKPRDSETSKPIDDLESLKWLWPIRITSMEVTSDISGSIYNVQSFRFGDLNYKTNKDLLVIDKAMSIQGEYVSDALENYFEQVNNYMAEKSISVYQLPDVYKLDISEYEELSKFRMMSPTPSLDSSRSVETTYSANKIDKAELDEFDQFGNYVGSQTFIDPVLVDKKITIDYAKAITINKNTSIVDAINKILLNSPDYQKEIKKTTDPNNSEMTSKEIPKRMHKVQTKVKYIDYDKFRSSYQKEITISVLPFDIENIILHPIENDANGKIKYNNMKKTTMKKRYYYHYTGLNDQVINFDISFNVAWAVYMPSQAGVMIDYENKNHGQYIGKSSQAEELLKDIKNTLKNSAVKPNENDVNSINEKINSAEISDDEKEQLRKILSYRRTDRVATPTSIEQPRPSFSFVEDYSPPTNNNIVKMIFKESSSAITHDYTDSIESPKGSAKHIVNALYHQAFQSQTSGNAVSLELEVKGDPYWLEENGLGKSSLGDSNLLTKHPSILFTISQPEQYDESTGIINKNNSSFTGAYVLRSITHTFSGGVFKQSLLGSRDVKISNNDVKGDS